MYILKDNKKMPIHLSNESVVEGFAVDWKSSKTWLIIGGVGLLLILLIVLFMCMKKQKSQSY